jgi:hypothetical protein
LVLYPLWQTSTVLHTGHHNFALTTPSLLSRGTLGPALSKFLAALAGQTRHLSHVICSSSSINFPLPKLLASGVPTFYVLPLANFVDFA